MFIFQKEIGEGADYSSANYLGNAYRYAYTGCPWYISRENETKVEFETEITSIGPSMFRGCTKLKLKNVELPKKIQTIGNYAFYDCSNIETIGFSEAIKEVGSYAFSGCSKLKLKNINLPTSIQSIGSHAFEKCNAIDKITITSSDATIGEYAFLGCTGLRELKFNNDSTKLNKGSFKNCTSINKITLPISLKVSWPTPDDLPFTGCTGLSEIKFLKGSRN